MVKWLYTREEVLAAEAEEKLKPPVDVQKLHDEENLRRINSQIWCKYPTLNIEIKLDEYRAAKAQCKYFIKDNIGTERVIDGHNYDRDAVMRWYPEACKGKIEIDLRSSSRGAIVTPTSMMFADRYMQTDHLQRTWIELKAGAQVERHCKKVGRHFQETDDRTVQDYALLVSSAPDSLKQKAIKTFPEHRQRNLELAS